jgi:hypothetical protein
LIVARLATVMAIMCGWSSTQPTDIVNVRPVAASSVAVATVTAWNRRARQLVLELPMAEFLPFPDVLRRGCCFVCNAFLINEFVCRRIFVTFEAVFRPRVHQDID